LSEEFMHFFKYTVSERQHDWINVDLIIHVVYVGDPPSDPILRVMLAGPNENREVVVTDQAEITDLARLLGITLPPLGQAEAYS
jgi:hypothetical protein